LVVQGKNNRSKKSALREKIDIKARRCQARRGTGERGFKLLNVAWGQKMIFARQTGIPWGGRDSPKGSLDWGKIGEGKTRAGKSFTVREAPDNFGGNNSDAQKVRRGGCGGGPS